ncbi:MAG: hypothetical protein JO345_20100 [Streptosporangiaceae bacterium]|nr:hypothetical protein [Streptosporangiaceae bacterium]
MGRPPGYQWQPLGLDTDPVPGDPQAVSAEAAHLASVARTIAGQVTAMRKIASDNTEKGQHADKIRSEALSLAGSLQAVAARYQKVSSALSGWVPELEQAQALSLRALNEAEVPYAKLHRSVMLPSDPNLTAIQKQEIADYHSSIRNAEDQLDAAKALLTRATTLRDTHAAYYAAKINQASNDSLTDHESLWGEIVGHIDHWVGDVAWAIKDVSTVLEVAATIAGVLAFVIAQFIPGLDVVVDALVLGAFVATAFAAEGREVLALTGNGAWRDFAFDAVALASFGVGRWAGTVAAKMVPVVEGAARGAYTSELVTDIANETPRAAMLEKWAAQVGSDSVRMANQVARFAPSLANGATLSGFAKVMASLGAFGGEESNYARIISLANRFTTPISDLSLYADRAQHLLTITGVSAGAGSVTGISGTALGGVELDWFNDPILKADIPPLYHWYNNHLWAPAGG